MKYTPSWAMKPGYLQARMALYRKMVKQWTQATGRQ